jgi:hypothetical protein
MDQTIACYGATMPRINWLSTPLATISRSSGPSQLT